MLVSLFALGWGGPLARRLKTLERSDFSSITFERPASHQNDGLTAELLRERAEAYPNAQIQNASTPDISLLDWANAVFHKTRAVLGDLLFRRAFLDFSEAIGEQPVTLDSLRLFPGFLRSQKNLPVNVSSLSALELARVTSLFSPQSDEPGSGDYIIANPTLEIIESKFESEPHLVAIARRGFDLVERKIDWQEAAVFDEFRENPKNLKSALVSELENHSYSLTRLRDFSEVIEALTLERFLLQRDA